MSSPRRQDISPVRRSGLPERRQKILEIEARKRRALELPKRVIFEESLQPPVQLSPPVNIDVEVVERLKRIEDNQREILRRLRAQDALERKLDVLLKRVGGEKEASD